MAQYEFHIADYERIFRKQYKIVIVFVVLAVGFSVFFAKMKQPLYQTAATVKIDRNTVMGFSNEAMIYGTWDNIETQTKVIVSFPVLLRAAKRMGYIADSIPDDEHPRDEAVLSRIRDIGSMIATSITSGTNIVVINATSPRATEARDVANAVAMAYKDFSIYGKKLHALKTKRFIEAQLDACRADLGQIEDEIKAFEEGQRIPSLEENAKRIITDEGVLDEQLRLIDQAIGVIRVESENLVKRFTDQSRRAPQEGDRASDSLFLQQQMSWVSQFTDDDEGLRKLNTRLIELQILLDDQRSYYTKDHPGIRDIEKKVQETIEQIQNKYRVKIRELEARRSALNQDRERINYELRQLPTNAMTYARLRRRLEVAENLNAVLTTKLQEALIAEAGVVDDVTIMSLATMPDIATNQSVPRVAGVGVFLGLVLGIIFAILREMFDSSIGTIEDVERTLKLSVLAVIPHISLHGEQRMRVKDKRQHAGRESLTPRDQSVLVTHFNSKDPTAEAYRILRTNIEYLSIEKPLHTILVTSATMQEGKSTTIANLAVVFAQQGKKVLILELNMRRPALHKIFGFERGPGVTDILIDRVNWRQCIVTVTDLALGTFSMDDIFALPGLDNLHILPHGHTPPNPTELISSPKMEQLLATLREHFDIILVDGPPLLPVADSMIISKKVDGVLLVYMAGVAPRSSLRLTKERLETVQANIMGLVLNDIRAESPTSPYAAHSVYAYTAEKNQDKRKK